jgi:hypothetical protein
MTGELNQALTQREPVMNWRAKSGIDAEINPVMTEK